MSYHSEYLKTVTEKLIVNRVDTLDKQIILVPVTSPPKLDFQASTFHSGAVVTQKCGSHFIGRYGSDDVERRRI